MVEAKTVKNRARRQKKKGRAKAKSSTQKDNEDAGERNEGPDVPLKKRRLVNGAELVFRKPGEGNEDDEEDNEQDLRVEEEPRKSDPRTLVEEPTPNVAMEQRIVIHEDD